MINYKKVKPTKNETYEVALDDHCLVVKVGTSKVWLSEAMCEWIAENQRYIDFKKDEWRANVFTNK